MKTNIFYNSSPKLGANSAVEEALNVLPCRSEGSTVLCATEARRMAARPEECVKTAGSTDSLRFARPSNLEGQLKCTAFRMATVLCTLCSVLFLAACSETDEITPEYNDAPLIISATIPGDVWAVATRAGLDNSYTDGPGMTVTMTSYTNWTLHYTDYNDAAATGVLTATPTGGSTFSLTSGSDLVWAKVKDGEGDETFYLTCEGSDGVTYYATTTAAHGAASVAFTNAMKPTLAKLTVNFTLSHNMASNPSYGDFSIRFDAKQQGDSYDPMTHGGAWPIGNEDAIDGTIFSEKSSTTNTYTVTATMLLPQQVMDNTLTVTYKETTWTLNLNTVSVTGSTTAQTANMLIAGQHLTLNLSASILSVGAPGDIQIEAFTAASTDDYTPGLDGVGKTYEYDAASNTYYIYHEKCVEAALADRAANNPTAAIVSKVPTLAIVDGAEKDLATMKAAISGKTTIYVTGTTLAAYSGDDKATTVVGEAIYLLTAGTSISLVLPEATTIGNDAFDGCTALTSVTLPSAISIGNYAFYNCSALTSVSAPLATSIGKAAFFSSALTSVSAPSATSIGEAAFFRSALTSVSLPSVTSIGINAFYKCTALTNLTFESVIESVGKGAFLEVNTTTCALTLAKGQQHMTDSGTPNGTAVTAADALATEEARTWAGYTWNSITISNNQ